MYLSSVILNEYTQKQQIQAIINMLYDADPIMVNNAMSFFPIVTPNMFNHISVTDVPKAFKVENNRVLFD